MIIKFGTDLNSALREMCNKVKKRLWLAVPFIGNWETVRRILGKKWLVDENVEVRLLTDIDESTRFNYETIKCFQSKGLIKHLKGLHAKVYIADDNALVTSANLTNTSFTKRYEIGLFFSSNETGAIIKIFNDWWSIAEKIPPDWILTLKDHKSRLEIEETSGTGLERLWLLPPDPGDVAFISERFLDYENFCQSYADFADIYKNIQRVWPRAPLYLEIDSFLNYLYHEHQNIPSKAYDKKEPRRLDRAVRIREITRYAKQYKVWALSRKIDERWREKNARAIQQLLSEDNIKKLSWRKVKRVVDQLNSLNSVKIARKKFLNPRNNTLKEIKEAWRYLLYGSDRLQARMFFCNKKLYGFGRSSICELLGFRYPDELPIRNKNANAGLRFFGYDVMAY